MTNYTLNGQKLSQAYINKCALITENQWNHWRPLCVYPTRSEYIQKMVSQWRRRLHLEASRSHSYFCTLTYSEDNLPARMEYFDIKADLQRWIKRLRAKLVYRYKDVHIKYYLVSEFGDTNGRLHYHLILFCDASLSLIDLRNLFDCTWRNGRTQVKPSSPRRIHYVTKYIFKKYQSSDFCIILKSNGIGTSYLSFEFVERQRARGSRWMNFAGRRTFIPRYIAKKIWTDEEYRQINTSDGVRIPLEDGSDLHGKIPYIVRSDGSLISDPDEVIFKRIFKIMTL